MPLAWVLHDGKAGMRSQALGLAEATGFPFVEKPLEIRPPWSVLPPQLWLLSRYALSGCQAQLVPPWPDLVIGCGRNTVIPALAIRRLSGGRPFLAQVQDPRLRRSEFDLLIVPEHDRLRGPHVIVSRGAMHRVTPAQLAAERRRFPGLAAMPRPILAVLLGGSNKSYRLTARRLGEIADAIAAVLREGGGSALVTPSRRTGRNGLKLLQDRLAGLPAAVWNGTGDNPYFAYLDLADAFMVTAELGIDDQRGGGDRQAYSHPRTGRRQRQIRPFSSTDAAGRDYPPFLRKDRILVLPRPGRHRTGGRGIARIGFAPARPTTTAPGHIDLIRRVLLSRLPRYSRLP